MLAEVVICTLALFVWIGGVVAILYLALRNRTWRLLTIKYLLQAMFVAVPWVLHLPIAFGYYRVAQILGHAPGYYDSYTRWADDPFYQSMRLLVGHNFYYQIIYKYWTYIFAFVVIVPATFIGMVRQRRRFTVGEYWFTVFAQLISWFYLSCVSASYDWW